MANRRRFKVVEFLDERLVGHTAWKEGDQVFVEARVSGSVECDGVEYVFDEVVTVRAEKCQIPRGEE